VETQEMKTRTSGFTLIELVIVIVILGILAVTAAPKFLDLSSDAREGLLNGVKASMQTASTVVYSKALIAGVEKTAEASAPVVAVNGNDIELDFGYPISTTTNMGDLLDLDADFSTAVVANAANATVAVKLSSVDQAGDDATAADYTGGGKFCRVEYTESNVEGTPPTITVKQDGC